MAIAATALVAPRAEAADPPDAQFDLSRESGFGTPRLTWSNALLIPLQPQRARLMLALPSEWMPEPDLGILGARGISLVPKKEWEIQRNHLTTQAEIGPSVVLRIQDRAHAIDFGLRLMPRAAIAVLRFDPIAGLH